MLKPNFHQFALTSTIATLAVGVSTLSAQAATVINGTFSQTGFSGGGTLTGSFAGTDVDMNGILDTSAGDTLSALTATFSGNGTVNSFTLGLANLGSNFILPYSIGSFSATNFNFFLTQSSSFIDVLFEGPGGTNTTDVQDGNGNGTSSSSLFQVTVTQVTPPPPATTPEPSSIIASLVALGLGVLSTKRKLQ